MPNPAPGTPFPLGSTIQKGGVNFSIYSKHATGMQLLLFDDAESDIPNRVIDLDPHQNCTFHYWHVLIEGLKAGQHYAFRIPEACSRQIEKDNPSEDSLEPTLLDPYSKAVSIATSYRRNHRVTYQNHGQATQTDEQARQSTLPKLKSVVSDLSEYRWEDDRPLRRPFSETIIYEMHVRGFTQDKSSNISADRRGSYLGVIDKIPYLQELGITAVELLPVFQFDPQDAPIGLTNYWGYSPISFFAPHAQYASDQNPLTALDEFRDMVKALHRAGIEVILDVVYNHTAEGGQGGPTFCYKGLQNDAYYLPSSEQEAPNRGFRYANYSGCGNTLNANHSIVRRLILDSLRFWVQEMHVDGFRFDLASILSRDIHGEPQSNPPILWDIETDPILAGTKLIAEAWDAAGLYQVGHFFGDRWKEWNGRFRDDVRSFVKGDAGYADALAQRFLASPDIYGHRNREPEQSINFVTSHDGFTLWDLVSYNSKHNLSNREQNRDGHNENLSWNCGHEGPTDCKKIQRLRTQQAKNLATINLLSFGVPMILMGDEICRTKGGNNNTYCQDNEVNWLDWEFTQKNSEMLRFFTKLIQFRRELPKRKNRFLTLSEILEPAKISWHGVKLGEPDWSESSRSVAFTIESPAKWYHLIFNAYWEPLEFKIPDLPATMGEWKRIIDTSLDSPHDIDLHGTSFDKASYQVAARSSVLITAEPNL